MTEQEVERAIQELWALFEETDKKFKETDKKIEQTSREVAETTRNVNALTGKWGKFVEGLVAPGAVRMFKERGIEVKETYTRAESHRNGKKMEIDVLVVNETCVVAIEVKSTLKVEDVDDHLEKLRRFREFFPRFQDKKVVGAVAGIAIEEASDRYAYRQGLFVIGQMGETVNILNDEKFEPKAWWFPALARSAPSLP